MRRQLSNMPSLRHTHTLKELEEFYGNGFTDEVSGDVESPTGHFYRVGIQIVVTDQFGFNYVSAYRSAMLASLAFAKMEEEYSSWLGGQDND